jgi:hypothetical protein
MLITNEISAQNDLPHVCIVAQQEMEVTDLRGEGWSFIKRVKASIMLFTSLALGLDFTAYTTDFIHLQRWQSKRGRTGDHGPCCPVQWF